jgi:hypothetical protein
MNSPSLPPKPVVNTDMTTILLSYPRCGNTWMRYCIEQLSGRRAISIYGDEWNGLLGRINQSIKPILIKCHLYSAAFEAIYPSSSCPMILLLRNYKECIIRHYLKREITYSDEQIREIFITNLTGIQTRDFPPTEYIYNIIVYDKWIAPKLLIYYEDLITNPKGTLLDICNFLKIEIDNNFDNFINNIEVHKSIGMKLYGDCQSDGKSTVFHSRSLSPQLKNEIDQHLKISFPEIFKKYLTRYSA